MYSTLREKQSNYVVYFTALNCVRFFWRAPKTLLWYKYTGRVVYEHLNATPCFWGDVGLEFSLSGREWRVGNQRERRYVTTHSSGSFVHVRVVWKKSDGGIWLDEQETAFETNYQQVTLINLWLPKRIILSYSTCFVPSTNHTERPEPTIDCV